ncbi:MAG: CHASE domain-containing protein [Verrucomicrobia bacterium]|nr:CHASE domain-containing protein [Verrucomicrobiota bacterium]
MATRSMDAPRQPTPFFRRPATLTVVVVVVGAVLSALTYRDARAREHERAETAFARQAAVRHSVTAEQLGRYQDLLFTLRTMFSVESRVPRNTFVRTTRWLEGSYDGLQALEWVPFVPREDRAETEEATGKAYGQPFEFKELAPDGQLVRAGDRPFYYPIVYVHPVPGNERAWGYDLQTGPTRDILERARVERQMMVTGQIRLVQGEDESWAFVMAWPVFRRSEASVEPGAFLGFVQAVLRTRQIFEAVLSRQSETDLDMMFVDTSETDPARRLLYYRPAGARSGQPAPGPVPSDGEFRAGLYREFPLPIGGRDWRVVYRPTPQWLGEQALVVPWVRSAGILLMTGLVAGLVHTLGRQTEVIARTVAERTAELTESRRELDSFLASLPGMAYRGVYQSGFTVSYVSAGSLALLGYPPDDFVLGRVHLRDLIHPDDLARVRQHTRERMAAGRPVELEYRVRARDGTEKWVLSRGHPTGRSQDGIPVVEGLAIDITAQKHAEQERIALERKLLEGQKLESLGVLAGGIAHDFNNLLTGILGNANLVRLLLPAGSAVDPQLRAIETSSLRAAELCRQMLAYAGKGRFVVEPVDLGALASNLVPLLEVSIARKAALRFDLAPSLPTVLADATQLRQIVMNLVLNAADATGGKNGEIVLTTGVMRADRAVLRSCATGADLPEGDYVFLEVRDNGCGMSAEVVAKIFDPFYTTKFAGRGLGLAAVLGIVRGHQGALLVESEPERGSRFRLILPPTPAGSAPARPEGGDRPGGSWRHPGRALVIEDEEPVRTVTTAMLTTFGLSAQAATDGQTGLDLFRADPAGWSIVILDVLMPGLSGEETLVALRRLRPEVRVLLISGYNEGDLLRRLADARSPLAFLQKPFTREALEVKLRALLG